MATPLNERHDPDLYDRLCECTPAQLDWIEEKLRLEAKFTSREEIASRARVILDLVRQRGDGNLLSTLSRLVDDVQGNVEGYLLDRLKNFLVESPGAENTSPQSVGTVRELRAQLKERAALKERRLQKPVLVKVRGTLFPAALLTEGWWERKQKKDKSPPVAWKTPLQRWLFQGFDLWAPSWDVCWGAVDPTQEAKRYYIAQLTEGDEADSLPVIIGPETAKKLSDEFRDSWGGFEAVVVGLLGHRDDFARKLPRNEKRSELDYYISVEDGRRRHGINRLPTDTDLYSGYLWKLLAPSEWFKDDVLQLNQVYFVWEHTNFAAEAAVRYNLEGLAHKEELIAKEHPASKIILLQKSHDIVPGKPEWSVEKFYQLYLMQGKSITKGR